MTKNIIIVILLLFIGYGLFSNLFSWNTTTKTKTEIVTVIKTINNTDTITVFNEPKVIYRDKYTPIKLPIYYSDLKRTGKDSILVNLPYHVYSDTIVKDSSSFAYDIEVQGYLKKFSYSFNLDYPEQTKTITNTITKHRIVDLFGVGGISFDGSPYVGGDVVFRKLKLGYRIGYKYQSFELGYKIGGF